MVDMSLFTNRPALRWLVPAAVAVAVIGGGAAAGTVAASAEPELPDRSAAQLLVDLQTARLDGLSGSVKTTSDLGLPTLPTGATGGGAGITALVSGSHQLRVWYAGPDKARLALIGTVGESDIIRNGKDLWTWDSKTQAASHRTLGDGTETKPEHQLPEGVTPQSAAEQALKAVDPTTVVEVGRNARVAGRTAYELVLKPRDTGSLLGQVRIALDSKQHVPLRVLVYAKGSGEPAFRAEFTQVDFTRPDDAQFAFSPPPGTQVTEETEAPPAADPAQEEKARAVADSTKVVGTGWTTVVVMKAPATDVPDADDKRGPGQSGADMLGALPQVSGDWGSGRLLKGRLFSLLLTDDGRLLFGAVAPEKLYEAARG
jgi:outer membrane lipoprotein-sorting protein